MLRIHALAATLAASLVAGSLACTTPTEDAAVDDSAGSALSSNDVPGVVAVRMTRTLDGKRVTTTVAAAAKVEKIMRGLVKGRSMRSCGRGEAPDELAFLDASGVEAGTAVLKCGTGSLTVGGRTINIKDDALVTRRMAEADLVAADLLFGVDRVDITKIAGTTEEERSVVGGPVKDVVRALALDAFVQDPGLPPETCAVAYGLSFKRGEDAIGEALLCETARSATFFGTDPSPNAAPQALAVAGGLAVDPAAIAAAFARAAPR